MFEHHSINVIAPSENHELYRTDHVCPRNKEKHNDLNDPTFESLLST